MQPEMLPTVRTMGAPVQGRPEHPMAETRLVCVCRRLRPLRRSPLCLRPAYLARHIFSYLTKLRSVALWAAGVADRGGAGRPLASALFRRCGDHAVPLARTLSPISLIRVQLAACPISFVPLLLPCFGAAPCAPPLGGRSWVSASAPRPQPRLRRVGVKKGSSPTR